MASAFSQNLTRVRDQIATACTQAGRDPSDVHIIVVTKRHPVSTMLQVIQDGSLDLGENRVQEALPKLPHLPASARVHLIGQLQSNKVNKAVGRFATLGSVDRGDLLQRIDRRAGELGLVQDIWIQINAAGETQKGGVDPDAAADLWGAALECPHVRPRGVMAMARQGDDERATRATFARVRTLTEGLAPAASRPLELSMGMSGDFVWAVLEGATHLRLGTVLLGPRPG